MPRRDTSLIINGRGTWVPQLSGVLIDESVVWRAGTYPFLGGGRVS